MKIYLDTAATTQVDKKVVEAMLSYFSDDYGNPSEWHAEGRQAKNALEKSRLTVASFIKAKPEEIIFTASATESINLGFKGLIEALEESPIKVKPHIITSSVEHKAVLETCRHMERQKKVEVTYLPVDKYGLISLEGLKSSIKNNTVLVSVMYVNNEVGTVEPVKEIGMYLKDLNRKNKKIYFHTDATQAINYLNSQVNYLGVDLLTFSGHKIHAPKGIGVLYARQGTPLTRQIDGGVQERGVRAGTENIPYIVGLAQAIKNLGSKDLIGDDNILNLRNYLLDSVLNIPGIKLTGHRVKRVPHIASFVVEGVEGEALVLALSKLGISVSSGSACTSGDLSPSHVLTAMGVAPEVSHGSLRVSLDDSTTKKEIDYLLKNLKTVICKLRNLNPLYE